MVTRSGKKTYVVFYLLFYVQSHEILKKKAFGMAC